MEFSRQEHCSGLQYLFPGDLPNPGIEPRSPALQADSSLPEPPGKTLPQHNKGQVWQITANIILNGEKQKAFPLRSETRHRRPLSPLLFTVLESLDMTKEKKRKGIQIGREVKLWLFADDLILFIGNSKDATRKLLELSEFSKVAGHKINTELSLAFLYTNNKTSEREIKETMPLPSYQKE